MTMTDPRTWSREAQAKVATDGLMLESASATPRREFSAAKASAVTGDANTRLTTGEDAEPLIKRRS